MVYIKAIGFLPPCPVKSPINQILWALARCSFSLHRWVYCQSAFIFLLREFKSSPLLRVCFLLGQCCFPPVSSIWQVLKLGIVCFHLLCPFLWTEWKLPVSKKGSTSFSIGIYPGSVHSQTRLSAGLELLRRRCFRFAVLFPQERPQMLLW